MLKEPPGAQGSHRVIFKRPDCQNLLFIHSANSYCMPTMCQNYFRACVPLLTKLTIFSWNLHSRAICCSTSSLTHQVGQRQLPWLVPHDKSCLGRTASGSWENTCQEMSWRGWLPPNHASHPLWPTLLGGEAFLHLGEALQFSNNSLRCF